MDEVAVWLTQGFAGRSEKTVTMSRYILRPVLDVIGRRPLRKLTAADVRAVLEKVAVTRSIRTGALAYKALERVICHAEARDWAAVMAGR